MYKINKENTTRILKKNNLWAKKKFGQNFLISQNVLDNILKNANISKNDTVLEIGPGLGFLTERLSMCAKLVLAIEKDQDLVDYLRRKFKGSNVKIIADNIVFFDEKNIRDEYKIVANLPYNVTSPFLRKFLMSEHKPKEMTIMVQKEVAEKIAAKPGNSERSFLTLMVEYFSKEVEIVINVDKSCFWPEPSVQSAVIRIVLKDSKVLNDFEQSERFLKFIKMGFSQKRRQIHHPLCSGLHLNKDKVMEVLSKVGIKTTQRAEDLSLNEWIKIYQEFSR